MAGRCCKDVNVNIGDECLGLGRSTVKKPQRSFLDENCRGGMVDERQPLLGTQGNNKPQRERSTDSKDIMYGLS